MSFTIFLTCTNIIFYLPTVSINSSDFQLCIHIVVGLSFYDTLHRTVYFQFDKKLNTHSLQFNVSKVSSSTINFTSAVSEVEVIHLEFVICIC